MRTKAPALAPWPCRTSGLSVRDQAREMRSQTRKSCGDGSRRIARRCTPSFRRGAISASAAVGALAAGQAVGDDADMMAAIGLAVGEVEDVAEDAADRRAHRVQDTKRLVGRGRA